jgi:hypothetical protein
MEMQLLTNTRQASRLTRLAIAAALALALALVASPAAQASASDPTIGTYVTGSSYCNPGQILATAPGMTIADNWWPAGADLVTGGGQEIGFRVVLQKWAPPTATYSGHWYDLVAGPWFGRTASYVVLGQGAEPWTVYDPVSKTTKTSWDGNTYIAMNAATGYFRVRYDMYWYMNGKVSGSALRQPANGNWDNRDDKVYLSGWASYEWCRY